MATSYRFGEFRLVPATRELWRARRAVAVPPRAFDCIVYLVEHRERAVGRDELIAAVWGRTEAGDGTLGQTDPRGTPRARRHRQGTARDSHRVPLRLSLGRAGRCRRRRTADQTLRPLRQTTSHACRTARRHASYRAERVAPQPFATRRSRMVVIVALAALVAAVFGAGVRTRTDRNAPLAPGDTSHANAQRTRSRSCCRSRSTPATATTGFASASWI